MYKRPAYLIALATALASSIGFVGKPSEMVLPAGRARMARQNHVRSRSQAYGAHADPNDFPHGSNERAIVEAAVAKRRRKALLLPQ